VIEAVVQTAPKEVKAEVAEAAVKALSADQQDELVKSIFPTASRDRRFVYMTGFVVAGVVAISLALVAWGAADSANGVATAILVLATGFTSAILGGLLGAYVQR
jgi:hypothetical protein